MALTRPIAVGPQPGSRQFPALFLTHKKRCRISRR